MATALEASGDYRVLRKLVPRTVLAPLNGASFKTALFVDVETTGLDPVNDEIIELAMIPFTYGVNGQIFSTLEPFQSFQQPNVPISAEITAVTGITDEMVKGKEIDANIVEMIVAKVDLIIAHNANFDRRFLERFSPVFEDKPWACSIEQVNWRSEGFEGTRLGYLVAGAGYFYEKHRALNDCYAAIELLAKTLPVCGYPAMKQLLENARTPSWRIWALNAPYDLKELLRSRGYKWSSGKNGTLRAWWCDVPDTQREEELAYLYSEIYQQEVDIPMKRIDAYNRFSSRV